MMDVCETARLGTHVTTVVVLLFGSSCKGTARGPHETERSTGHDTPNGRDVSPSSSEVPRLSKKALERRLKSCDDLPLTKTRFSIGHRGAPAHYPEHTREGYEAAAKMGSGLVECDVVFTKDRVGVCRHSACDLHLTTDILTTPLSERCKRTSPSTDTERSSSVECCTFDVTVAEFKSLCGTSSETDDVCGTLVTHAESIALLDSLEVDFIPELKRPVDRERSSEKELRDRSLEFLVEYERAGIAPERVFPQSFDLDTIALWAREIPGYSKRSVYLDARYTNPEFDPTDASTFRPSMAEIRKRGAAFVGPPFWFLLAKEGATIRPTTYVDQARRAGLELIPWSVHRPELLEDHANQLKAPFSALLASAQDYDFIVHQLAQLPGVFGVFSDDPARLTRYANCFGL